MWILVAVPILISALISPTPIWKFLARSLNLDTLSTRDETTTHAFSYSMVSMCASIIALVTIGVLVATLFPAAIGLSLWFYVPLTVASMLVPLIFHALPFISASSEQATPGQRIIVALFLGIITTTPISAVLTLLSLTQIIQTTTRAIQSVALTALLPVFIADLALLKVRSYFKVNAKQFFTGNTALIHAANSGNLPALTRLLAKGADINAQNKKGNTALHAALVANVDMPQKLEIIRALLNARPNVSITNTAGETVIDKFGHVAHANRIVLSPLFARANITLPPQLLQNIAAGEQFNRAQSYMTPSVTRSAKASLRKLKERYKKIDVDTTLSLLKSEMMSLAKELTTPTEQAWIQPALKTLDKIMNKQVTYSETYPQDNSVICLKENLAYTWLGICDKNALMSKKKILSKSEILDRKKRMMQHLYECGRGYNINELGIDDKQADHPICAHGHSVKIISTLWDEHDDVKIIYITAASLTAKATQLVYTEFKALDKATQERYLQEWTIESGVPDELHNLILPKIEAALHAEFDEYKDDIMDGRGNKYEFILAGTLESLGYLPPPPPVVKSQAVQLAESILPSALASHLPDFVARAADDEESPVGPPAVRAADEELPAGPPFSPFRTNAASSRRASVENASSDSLRAPSLRS